MADNAASAWTDAPEVTDTNIVTEDDKKAMVASREVFLIVGMEYFKQGNYGPYFTSTLVRHDGTEWVMSLNAANPEMGRTKINAWIWRKLNKEGVESLPACLVKRGRAYSFADPEALPLPSDGDSAHANKGSAAPAEEIPF